MQSEFTLLQQIAIWALPVLFAITIHEVAHGWVASKLGDQTAKRMGRLTLNPLKHIDLMGTILIPGFSLALGGIVFGWAKPVPVNFRNLRDPKKDMALVAVAGPVTNFLMAIGWALIMKLAILFEIELFVHMGLAGITINLVLMVLNLFPIPPLDGSRVVSSLLPSRMATQYDRLERFGLLMLILLLISGVLGYLLSPPVLFLRNLFLALVGV